MGRKLLRLRQRHALAGAGQNRDCRPRPDVPDLPWANTSGSPNPCSGSWTGFDAGPGGFGLFTNVAASRPPHPLAQHSAAVSPPETGSPSAGVNRSAAEPGAVGNFDLASVSACPADTVPAAKMRPEFMAADLLARPVTAAFPDHFYVQEPDRSGGIMVRSASLPAGIGPGWSATASGVLRTDAAGERYLSAVVSAAVTGASPVPVCLLPGSIGGADWQYRWTGAGHGGVTGEAGAEHTGFW